jgi:DNA mismatch repair ATPase MutS
MKACLLYKNEDFEIQKELSQFDEALTQDLELNILFGAMSLGDDFLFDVAKKTLLSSLKTDEGILYRQDILKDCMKNASIVRKLYEIAVDAIIKEKKNTWGLFSKHPSNILYRSVDVLSMFVYELKELKAISDKESGKFSSEGFRTFFEMIKKELSDEYFATVQDHLQRLKFRDGVLISAELSKSNTSRNYTLRKPNERNKGWLEKTFSKKSPTYSFYIAERDENGARILSELKDRGINLVANALAQSNDHILSFFNMLRMELGFYIGCLNLYDTLSKIEEPICFPVLSDSCALKHSFKELYDISLALTIKRKVVDNEIDADGKGLVIITGANQGGKSTFIRSIGQAQLMLQCGMFVPAKAFSANISNGLFTHFKREEDKTMESGKLDEELSRMSDIVDNIKPNSIMLFNESFAATNEREGSEIARQITSALLEKRIKIFFVTHQYELAHTFYSKKMNDAIFLRAERQPDGTRTFKLIKGEPLETSFGEDLYNNIFTSNQQ